MAENPGTTKSTGITLTPDQIDAFLKGSASGTGAISAPQGQANLAIKNDNFDPKKPLNSDPTSPDFNWPIIGGASGIPSPNPTPKPSTTAPAHFGSDATGYWIEDPTAPNGVRMVVPPNTPNADDEMNKALERIDRQQAMTEKQDNFAQYGIYADTKTVQDMQHQAVADKLSAAEFQQKVAQYQQDFGEKQRQFDIQQAAKDKTDAANIGLTTAQTQRTGLEGQQIQQNMDVTQAKLPGDLRQQQATLEGTQASTAGTQANTQRTLQQIQQSNAPTVQNPQTGMYTYQRDPTTGAITATGMNPEYLPKTQAEIAARVGQIQTVANAKAQEVQGKVGQIINGQKYTPQDALAEYNAWYDQQVGPQVGELQQAQQQNAFDQARQAAEQQRSNYQTALGAGTQAINAFAGMQAGRVGSGWDAASAAASRGDFAGLGNIGNAVTYQAPDLTQTANSAVMDALKYISPTAAAATGNPLPQFQNIDIQGQLNQLKYLPGAPPSQLPPAPDLSSLAAAGAPSAPAAPAAPGAPFTQAYAGQAFKPGWPGSDPRLSGIYDPTQYVPQF